MGGFTIGFLSYFCYSKTYNRIYFESFLKNYRKEDNLSNCLGLSVDNNKNIKE